MGERKGKCPRWGAHRWHGWPEANAWRCECGAWVGYEVSEGASAPKPRPTILTFHGETGETDGDECGEGPATLMPNGTTVGYWQGSCYDGFAPTCPAPTPEVP